MAIYPSGTPFKVLADTGSFYQVESYWGRIQGYVLKTMTHAINGSTCDGAVFMPSNAQASPDSIAIRARPVPGEAYTGKVRMDEACFYGHAGAFLAVAVTNRGHVGFAVESDVVNGLGQAQLDIEPSSLDSFSDVAEQYADPERAAMMASILPREGLPGGDLLRAGDKIRYWDLDHGSEARSAKVVRVVDDGVIVSHVSRHNYSPPETLTWREVRAMEVSRGKPGRNKPLILGLVGGGLGIGIGAIVGLEFPSGRREGNMCWFSCENPPPPPEPPEKDNSHPVLVGALVGTAAGVLLGQMLRREEWLNVPLSISPTFSQQPGLSVQLTLGAR